MQDLSREKKNQLRKAINLLSMLYNLVLFNTANNTLLNLFINTHTNTSFAALLRDWPINHQVLGFARNFSFYYIGKTLYTGEHLSFRVALP